MRSTFITPVSSTYGAPMGRHTGPEFLDVDAGKVYLSKIPLDNGGYDKGGAYWGLGEALWETSDQDSNGFIFRARDRARARAHILDMFEGATFYR
jgi:hypothetical protein